MPKQRRHRTGPRSSNYLRKLRELVPKADPQRINLVQVYHNDACEIWAGGACDCQPDVNLDIHETPESALRAMEDAEQGEPG